MFAIPGRSNGASTPGCCDLGRANSLAARVSASLSAGPQIHLRPLSHKAFPQIGFVRPNRPFRSPTQRQISPQPLTSKALAKNWLCFAKSLPHFNSAGKLSGRPTVLLLFYHFQLRLSPPPTDLPGPTPWPASNRFAHNLVCFHGNDAEIATPDTWVPAFAGTSGSWVRAERTCASFASLVSSGNRRRLNRTSPTHCLRNRTKQLGRLYRLSHVAVHAGGAELGELVGHDIGG